MEDLINQLITTGLGLGLLGGTYLVWLLTGVANNLFSSKDWSWKRTLEDVAKTSLMAIAILAWVAVCNGVDWFALEMGADISALLDGASVAGVIGGIISGTIYYLAKAYRNIIAFVGKDHTVEVKDPNYKAIADAISEFFNTPDGAVEAQKNFEEEVKKAEEQGVVKEGGLGKTYSVPYNTYDAFRNAVNGKGYDLDNAYGAQCWDGACLLWSQIGRWLSTGGTGAARGCWHNARVENAGNDFELVYNKADIKRGDVVVFGSGNYGHIGFADEDWNGNSYIRLLGQNQGGVAYPGGGSNFNIINMSLGSFLGAFRFKKWKTTPAPTPTPTPTPTPSIDFKPGDTVEFVTPAKDVNGTNLAVSGQYSVMEVNGGSVVVGRGGVVTARVYPQYLKKVNAPVPKPTPTPTPKPEGFKVGDTVVPTKLVDYNGTPLVQYDPTYTISSISGNRAVLSARGAVWAAMNTANIRKA